MKPRPARLAIVAGDFHKELAEEMISAAQAEAAAVGATVKQIVRVAGSYEVPLVVSELFRRRDVDGVIVLGYIERGETLHGVVLGHAVAKALLQLQITHRKPLGFGIIGPGATRPQAEARQDGAARGAVRAVLRSLNALAEL